MSSSHTRKNLNKPVGPHLNSLNKIMQLLKFSAEHHVTNDTGVKSIAKGVCDMINLFTVKELVELQKKDTQFFEVIQALFYAIGHSSSKSSKVFMSICKTELGEKNKILNSVNSEKISPLSSKLIQAGGGFGTMTIIVMIMWLLMCVDLLANPGTAVTLSIVMKYLLSYSGVDKVNDFVKGLFGVEEETKFPIAFAEGRGVHTLSDTDGASGKAYRKLRLMNDEVEEDVDLAEEVVVESHVKSTVGMANLVSCASTGTCSSPIDTMVGMALNPLAAADAARPKLSAEQLANEESLKSLQTQLATEEGRWFMNKNPSKITSLTESITTLQAQITAKNIQQGLVKTLPSLSNAAEVTGVLRNVSRNLVKQVSFNGNTPSSLILRPALNSSVVLHRNKASVITSEALVAVGINGFSVEIEKIAKHHPESEVDLATVNSFGQAFNLLVEAQQIVGSSTKVDVSKINSLVDKLFKGKKEENKGMVELFGLIKVNSKDSDAKEVLTALVTEAAGNQALANARRKQNILNAQVSQVLDSNIQSSIHTLVLELTNKLIALGFKGGRDAAEKAAIYAIDTSRMFGVKPNMDTSDYALSVIACMEGGACPKKPFTEMRDRGELMREMSSWGILKRFQHAKWNILISLLFMLPTGMIADALLLTAIGVGGCVGRLTLGDPHKRQLVINAARANARRADELAEAKHKKQLRELNLIPAALAAPPAANQPAAAALAAPAAPAALAAPAAVNQPAPAAVNQPAPAAQVAINQAAQDVALNSQRRQLRANANAKKAEADAIYESMRGKTFREQANLRSSLFAAKEAHRIAEKAYANATRNQSRGGTRKNRK